VSQRFSAATLILEEDGREISFGNFWDSGIDYRYLRVKGCGLTGFVLQLLHGD
jgi:hypothetical protein